MHSQAGRSSDSAEALPLRVAAAQAAGLRQAAGSRRGRLDSCCNAPRRTGRIEDGTKNQPQPLTLTLTTLARRTSPNANPNPTPPLTQQEVRDERALLRLSLPVDEASTDSGGAYAQWDAPDSAPMQLLLGEVVADGANGTAGSWDAATPSDTAPPCRSRWRAESVGLNGSALAAAVQGRSVHRAPLRLGSTASTTATSSAASTTASASSLVLQLLPSAEARRGAPARYRLAAHALRVAARGASSSLLFGRGATASKQDGALGCVVFGAAAPSAELMSTLRAEVLPAMPPTMQQPQAAAPCLQTATPRTQAPPLYCLQVLGRGHHLALHTGDLCAAAAATDVRRCLDTLAPLTAVAPLMAAPGAADAPLAGCGGAWAERWWALRLSQAQADSPPPPEAAHCGAAGTTGAGGAAPWYSFVRGDVLFVALSSEHPMGPASAQARFAQRVTRLRPRGGWVVALAHSGGAAADSLLRALLPDVLFATAVCAGKEDRRSWACVSPPPDGYARLRVLSHGSRGRKGPALQVERVRTTDGEVLGAFEIEKRE